MAKETIRPLLQFRKDYPEAAVSLDNLLMIFNASKAVLQSQTKNPTMMEIIEFSKVVIKTLEGQIS
jgi:hypothetical protein